AGGAERREDVDSQRGLEELGRERRRPRVDRARDLAQIEVGGEREPSASRFGKEETGRAVDGRAQAQRFIGAEAEDTRGLGCDAVGRETQLVDGEGALERAGDAT